MGDSYYDAKQRLIADEQHVLRALVFDVGQFQPHKWLLNMCRSCRCSARVTQHACAVLNDRWGGEGASESGRVRTELLGCGEREREREPKGSGVHCAPSKHSPLS